MENPEWSKITWQDIVNEEKPSFSYEIAYMNYVCEIREKNEILEPIPVIFN